MTDQNPSSQPHAGQQAILRDDEIDLGELFAKIWGRKWWVVASTCIVAVAALVYVLNLKPTYELMASFRPVLAGEFVKLNQSEVLSLNPQQAFERYRRNLESRALRRELFKQPAIRQGFIPEATELTDDQLFQKFDERLALTVPVANKNQILVSDANHLKFQHSDPGYGATVVNRLLEFTNEQSVAELQREYAQKRSERIAYLQEKINEKVALAKASRLLFIEQLEEQNTLKILNVKDRLEVARQKAKARRFDRIEQLKEAIAIAKGLDIVSPTTLARLTQEKLETQTMINAEVGDRREPLYLRGTRLLTAELKALQQRQMDDFSDESIRELEAELELLKRHREVEMLQARENDKAFIADKIQPLLDEIEALKGQQVDFDKIRFSRIDQPAMVPTKPIKPKKRLIVSAAVVLGGMLGLFIALVVPARKEEPV